MLDRDPPHHQDGNTEMPAYQQPHQDPNLSVNIGNLVKEHHQKCLCSLTYNICSRRRNVHDISLKDHDSPLSPSWKLRNGLHLPCPLLRCRRLENVILEGLVIEEPMPTERCPWWFILVHRLCLITFGLSRLRCRSWGGRSRRGRGASIAVRTVDDSGDIHGE